MSADTPRSIDRTPRQVAGPGVEHDLDDDLAADPDGSPEADAPRDPHLIAADPGDVEHPRADDDVADLRDPDVTPADEPPPAHLTDPPLDEGDDGDDDAVPAHAGEPVSEPGAVADDAPDLVADEPEPDPVAVDDADADAEPGPLALGEGDAEPEPAVLDDADAESEPAGTVLPDEAEPVGLADTEPDAEPVAEPAADVVPVPDPDLEPVAEQPAGVTAGFMADASALRDRWESVQVGFVDDPRRAVEEAHEMVAAAVAELQAQIDRQRDELGGPWRDDAGASTDALLSAFQGYRDLFDRVLAV